MSEAVKFCGFRVGEANRVGSFSGNSTNLLGALGGQGLLQETYSCNPSKSLIWLFRLLNFHSNLDQWRLRARRDPRFFDALNRMVIKKLRSNPAAIGEASHSMQIGAWYSLAPTLKVLNPRLICCSFHDGNFATSNAGLSQRLRLPQGQVDALMAREQRIYGELDQIFVMSDWLKSSFINDFHVLEDKVTTVGSGLTLPDSLINPKTDYTGKEILFIGTDFLRKGGHVLLRAFEKVRARIPEARLHLIGPELNDPPPGVRVSGFVSRGSQEGIEFFKKALAQASVYAMPSSYEPFGISFVEAMANRLPCIGANVCAMPEIIEHGHSGYLVPPTDEDDLANRLLSLLASPEKCREMGKRGFEIYEARFTWQAVTSRILSKLEMVRNR